jgi:hypothetical protein
VNVGIIDLCEIPGEFSWWDFILSQIMEDKENVVECRNG